MKKLFLFVIGVSMTLDGCSGGLDMTMKPSAGFKKTSSVAVESDIFDSANLQSKIEKALFRNGIDVISPSFAQTGVQLQGDPRIQISNQSPQGIADSASPHSSTSNGQAGKSACLLKFTYDFDYTFSGEVITDFSAAIVEPGTGEVVGIMSYRGDGDGTAPDELADIIGKKLSQQLK